MNQRLPGVRAVSYTHLDVYKRQEVPLFGMVKDDKHRTRAIALSGGEIAINSNRRAFTLVSSIQDEVHRFAIGYHRQQRRKSAVSSTPVSYTHLDVYKRQGLLQRERFHGFPTSFRRSAIKASTFSSLVAQLVQIRTAVWVSSTFSQKENT